jgi:SAM-dependent methyltransferase
MQNSQIDNSNTFDWGKTSGDYSKYRPGYPSSFYDLLSQLGIGRPQQKILDIGTGTGVLAREFAKKGSMVTGIDISPEQIEAAQNLSRHDKLTIDFRVLKAEDISDDAGSFDIISSGQSWIYFDHNKLLRKLKIIAKGGKLVLTHLSWLPFEDDIAKATEALVLKYNPNWKGAGYKKAEPNMFSSLIPFELLTFHRYKDYLPFTREGWKGRIRACRGVGAFLTSELVKQFDHDHGEMLGRLTEETFSVLHEISIHIYQI